MAKKTEKPIKTFCALARHIAELEGNKKQVNIAQIREILTILGDELATRKDAMRILNILVSNGVRRQKSK